MTLHSEASDGAILNYLAGTTDAASSGALRRIAALVAAMQGAGSPEGVLTAAVGSLYTDTTNGVLYVKATGTGNTGWSALTNGDLSLKANLAGPTFTGTVTLPSTTSIGNVSSTELGYVDGVTSAIQTQLGTKAPVADPTFTGTVTTVGCAVAYVAKTGTYTVTTSDFVVDATSGTFTATLPTAVTTTGRQFVIKNSGTGVLTLATTSSQTIDGATTRTLNQYDSVTVVSNGANWIVI